MLPQRYKTWLLAFMAVAATVSALAAFLDGHPGPHTAGQIARGLSGRSAGAVANALT